MEKIRLAKSIVGRLEKEALNQVINGAYLGMGSFVQQFESRLKEYLGAKYVICVNSGTAALHLALMATGFQPKDEVLVQSLTFVASFQAISAAGLVPVSCEVVPETCTIDLNDAKKRLTKRTKAIMPVHYASRTGNLHDIYVFAKKYNLRVIEDAAHAFGTTYYGRKVGSFGDIVCFSFDGIKNITSGEGGAVVTADKKIAEYIMDGRLLGVKKDTHKRYSGERSWMFDVTHQGYRYHMSNLFAAIGITQLERFEKEFKPIRQRIARKYCDALSSVKDIILFPDDYDEIAPHIFPVRVLNKKRNRLWKYLQDNNIECGMHYYPNHLLAYYGAQKGKLPVTEELYAQLISLPLHSGLKEKEQDYIIKKIGSYFSKS